MSTRLNRLWRSGSCGNESYSFAARRRILANGATASSCSKGKLTHRIELPYGVLTLLVKRGKSVEEPRKSSDLAVQPGSEVNAITSSDQLLRNAIRNLTPEQMSQISLRATEEAVNLQTEAIRADQRFHNASRDIDSFIQGTQKLKDQDVSFSNSGTFNTASGTTSIQSE